MPRESRQYLSEGECWDLTQDLSNTKDLVCSYPVFNAYIQKQNSPLLEVHIFCKLTSAALLLYVLENQRFLLLKPVKLLKLFANFRKYLYFLGEGPQIIPCSLKDQ